MQGDKTLTEFIIGEQRRFPHATGNFTALLNDIHLACKRIAYLVGRGALAHALGHAEPRNTQGVEQMKLDVMANEIFLRTNEWGGQLAGMASEELEHPHAIPDQYPRGRYLLVFDPLDGSSNVDVNVSVGSIFSVLRAPEGVIDPLERDFLQPGVEQACAGYAIYGPTTMLVITLGRGVYGFTLDRETFTFVLTHPQIRIPADTQEFAINMSNMRRWEPPVRRYIDECLAGAEGPRGKDFNMRWVASMVADVFRVLSRGGIFMYPRDARYPEGRLRLMYEAKPMAFIVEQAGGAATDGRSRILDLQPKTLHQRVAVVLGSKNEVELVARYHQK